MRTRTLTILLLCSSLAPLAAQTAEGKTGERPRRERREAAPVELKNFRWQEAKFASPAIGKQEVDYGIYLPKGYDDEAHRDTKWPLVIWLHGMFEDHRRFHERGGAPVLDQCVTDGKLPACVFVTANGGRTSMYVNRKDQRWEDLITQDLLQHLSQTYRISAQREQRAIMGVSMGGMAALRIAFTQPTLFGAVGAHSSAVFGEDPEQLPERMKGMAQRLGLDEVFGNPIQKDPWQKANPLCLANAAPLEQLQSLRIYFDAGSNDRYGFAAGNELLHQALDRRKVQHTWRLIEGGGHSWGAGFQDQTLPFSFGVVGAMFLTAAGPTKPCPDDGKAGKAPQPPATGGGK
jgi:S-formylglutathione hydrolase